MLQIYPVYAFNDNYIWILHNEKYAVVVDPGIAKPVIDYLNLKNLQLTALLITHHHNDHTGGIIELLEKFNVPVYGPQNESIATLTHLVKEGDEVFLKELCLTLNVLDIPGHTVGHVAYYYGKHETRMLFCGDTLFACGCGRVFEGTVQQMYQSLQKLADLPAETLVYCAHEYTLKNIQFARTVEPGNLKLEALENTVKVLRSQNLPTIPTTILKEKMTNPFLRCDHPEIIQYVCKHLGKKLSNPVSVFSTLRSLKDNF